MPSVPNSDTSSNAEPESTGTDGAVLLLSPAMADDVHDRCGALLGVDDPDGTDYLSVSLRDGPGEVLEHWRQYVDPELPARTGIVCTGELTRSASAAAEGDVVRFPGEDVQVASVSSPGDLTGLGMRIGDCLSSWAGDGNRTVVCVDSLTTLLQYVETSRAFRFVHVLLARFESAGARAHVHMDPRAHDDRTVATMSSLFDAVLRREDDEWVRE